MYRGLWAISIIILLMISISFLSKPYSTIQTDNILMNSEVPVEGRWSTMDGTFIQWWLVKDWDDERWMQEFKILKEAGMNYIILAPTAFSFPGDSTTVKTIYPTNKEGFEVLKDERGQDYPDIVDACLRNAKRAGMKVFLGMNFTEEWWEKRLDAQWVMERMEEGNRVADELWENYYQKYQESFYGFYWCWEVDNFYFSTIDLFKRIRESLTNAIKFQIDHFKNTGKNIPFMLSPYMDERLGSAQAYARLWEYIFVNSGLREGDIFCLQDSVGTRGLSIDNLDTWFSKLRIAVDAKPGLQFWANIENFDDRDWSPAFVNRFIEQMEKVKPYVDKMVTFSYSHYYSPQIVDSGFHRTYVEYLNTGEIDTVSPSAPQNLKAEEQEDGSIALTWKGSTDNIGVWVYYIYRNGKIHKKVYAGEWDEIGESNNSVLNFIDNDVKSNATYVYEIQAYDFAGNSSEKSLSTTVSLP